MIKKVLNRLYIKRKVILKIILLKINNLIYYIKNRIIIFILFPFKVIKAIKNILFASIWKNIDYISKTNYKNNIPSKKIAICIGFTEWKREYFQEYIPDKKAYFLHNYIPNYIIINILNKLNMEYDVYIWSYLEKKELLKKFRKDNITIYRVEDGFVRSVGLGANQTKPLSLIIDKEDLYFNATSQSGLESIILKDTQKYTDDKIEIARNYIDTINTKKITKYNFKNNLSIDELNIYLNPDKKTILVIGQVEDDMSIKLGCENKITNLELLKLAYEENKNCNIIFKPHPDILYKKRNTTTTIEEYQEFALVVIDNFALFDLINISEHVYTITSLSGFEALLQGKKVTCFGSPFYAHWGLTDDRSRTIKRRENITLSIEQLFYAAYIQYPKYLLGDLSSTINAIDQFEYIEEYLYEEKLQILDTNFEIVNINKDDYKNKKVAILTSNKDILDLYNPLKLKFYNIDFFTFTHAEATSIIETNLVNAKDFKWLSRFYAIPFSDEESKSVSLASNISKIYGELLDKLFDDIFQPKIKEKLISALSLSLEDGIYDNCTIIESLESLNRDYDKIILHIDSHHKILNFSNLLISKIQNNKILYANNSMYNIRNFYNKLYAKNNNLKNLNSLPIKTQLFKKHWYTNLDFSNNQIETDNKMKIMLCGNLSNRNYGYAPSSIEIIKILDNFNIKQTFLASHKLNEQSTAQYKWLLKEIKQNIYFIDIINTEKGKSFKSKMRIIINDFKKKLFIIISTRYSSEMAHFIQKKLFDSLDNLLDQLLFFSNMVIEFQNYSLFITTMDRTIYSRLATIAAQMNGINTIGIQPVLLSTTTRYKKAIVDFMYVVDDMQKENYKKLGYSEDRISCVGSTNLRKNINLIKEEEVIDNFANDKISILFIMQHSMSTVMLNILNKLILICKNNNLILYIKPHPHQEKSTISEVQILEERYKNIILLNTKENTYAYVKNCDIVVGLYSNVVFEAILSDKDVLIIKTETLHESIDFSKLNISILSEVSNNIYKKLLDFINNTVEIKEMRLRRKEFIETHEYYYSNNILKKALKNEINKSLNKVD